MIQMILTTAIFVSVLAHAGVAWSQSRVSPTLSEVKDPTCLMADSSQRCLLKAEHRGIELGLNSERELTIILKGIGPESETQSSPAVVILMPVHDDLLSRVDGGQMTADEATWIAADLGRFEGTWYAIPKLETLKTELGFPAEAVFQAEDLRELVRAHLQIVLGVSAVTAAYLSDRMGLVSNTGNIQSAGVVALTADNAIVIAPEPESASLPRAMTADDVNAIRN